MLLGQLDIDADVKVGTEETKRITQWLREQSAAWGIAPDPDHSSAPVQGFSLGTWLRQSCTL